MELLVQNKDVDLVHFVSKWDRVEERIRYMYYHTMHAFHITHCYKYIQPHHTDLILWSLLLLQVPLVACLHGSQLCLLQMKTLRMSRVSISNTLMLVYTHMHSHTSKYVLVLYIFSGTHWLHEALGSLSSQHPWVSCSEVHNMPLKVGSLPQKLNTHGDNLNVGPLIARASTTLLY